MARILASVALVASGCAASAQPVERLVASPIPTAAPTPLREGTPAPEVRAAASPVGEQEPAQPGPSGEDSRILPSNQVADLILAVFGPIHGPRAVRVARCESGLNPRAVSRDGAVGVFQIMPRYHQWRVAKVGGTSLYDAATNVRVAHHLWSEQGWRPWTCA